jgi:uncharacterized Zn finger protein
VPNQSTPRSFTPGGRRFEGPRKLRDGIRLSGRLTQAAPQDAAETNTIGRRLLALVEPRIAQPQLQAGWDYARLGQIARIDFRAGEIDAHVQGSEAKPYHTIIRFPSFVTSQWDDLIQAMAGEAVYLAKLLAGELPATFEELLASRGLSLLPQSPEQIEINCTCPFAATADEAGETHPCKHAAAVAYLAAEQLLEKPTVVLNLLGLPAEQVLEQVQRARSIDAQGSMSAAGDLGGSDARGPAPPLEDSIHEFWRSPLKSSEWDELENREPSHHVPHALLRRLGPSPLNGRFPMVGLLASVYDTVAEAARKLRDAEE